MELEIDGIVGEGFGRVKSEGAYLELQYYENTEDVEDEGLMATLFNNTGVDGQSPITVTMNDGVTYTFSDWVLEINTHDDRHLDLEIKETGVNSVTVQ